MYDPDLPSYQIYPEIIDEVSKTIVELPFEYKYNLIQSYELSVEQAQFMYSYPKLVEYFEILCGKLKGIANPQLVNFRYFTYLSGIYMDLHCIHWQLK